MKYLFGALVLASIVSLLSISLIPRELHREEVAQELDRTLAGETVLEKNVSEENWEDSKAFEPDTYDAFGATVSRSGIRTRIYFDQKKLRFQKHPVTGDPAPAKP